MHPETRWQRFLAALWELAPLWLQAWDLRWLAKKGVLTAYDYACLYCNDDEQACCAGCDCCWPVGRCHAATGEGTSK